MPLRARRVKLSRTTGRSSVAWNTTRSQAGVSRSEVTDRIVTPTGSVSASTAAGGLCIHGFDSVARASVMANNLGRSVRLLARRHTGGGMECLPVWRFAEVGQPGGAPAKRRHVVADGQVPDTKSFTGRDTPPSDDPPWREPRSCHHPGRQEVHDRSHYRRTVSTTMATAKRR